MQPKNSQILIQKKKKNDLHISTRMHIFTSTFGIRFLPGNTSILWYGADWKIAIKLLNFVIKDLITFGNKDFRLACQKNDSAESRNNEQKIHAEIPLRRKIERCLLAFYASMSLTFADDVEPNRNSGHLNSVKHKTINKEK